MSTIILFSSTQFLADNPKFTIKGRPLQDFNIAYITTASKPSSDKGYMKRSKEIFDSLNLHYTEIDLDGKTENGLRELFQAFDAVYIQGGNTFYLLKAIRESGFEKVIKELLPKGFVYMGVSAGAYVACPTIEVSGWRYKEADKRFGITDLRALSLVPFLVKAHYDPKNRDDIKEKMKTASLPVKLLTDEQAVIVEDGNITYVGGPEIFI